MAACEYCRGRGAVFEIVVAAVLAAEVDATMVVYRNPDLPCPACGGSGWQSCCDVAGSSRLHEFGDDE